MAISETVLGSVVVLYLNPDGTLQAGNVERRVQVLRDGVPMSETLERDVLTAESLAAVLPDQGALLLSVKSLETELATMSQDLATVTTARDALQAQIDAAAKQTRAAVTPVQARLALKQAGLLTTVASYIEGLPEDDDARIVWDFAVTWDRNSPLIAQIGSQFGLSAEQIDNLFALAATL